MLENKNQLLTRTEKIQTLQFYIISLIVVLIDPVTNSTYDQLNIFKGQTQIIWCQLFIKVYNVHSRLVSKKVFEVLAAGGQHHLVGPQNLTLAHQGDVHIEAGAEVLTQRGENGVPLFCLEATNNIRGRVNHGQNWIDTVSQSCYILSLQNHNFFNIEHMHN